MPDRRMKKAQSALKVAVREMEAALVANPLVADPLMATAQVLEDLGEMLLGQTNRPKPGKKASRSARSSKPGEGKRAGNSSRKKKK